MEVINKYKEDSDKRTGKPLLPLSSNQKTNSYLKEIATVIGTFHVAIHTFVTT